jgi:hypothetical protein
VELDVVNQPPVVHDINLSTRSGEPLPITLTAEDPEQGSLRFFLVFLPRFGVFEGSLSNLVHRPPRGFFGVDRFVFAARDDHQPSSGGAGHHRAGAGCRLNAEDRGRLVGERRT